MFTYTWFGLNCDGRKINGIDCAQNRKQLENKLKEQGIFPLRIKRKFLIDFLCKSRIKTKHIASFIEQLAILINANVTLVVALNIIIQDEEHAGLKNLIIKCKDSLSSGQSLHKTLCQYPQHFNEILCSLINVGEQSGSLGVVLVELANYFAKNAIQKRKIIKALFYPLIVFGIAFVVSVVLLLFVIPQFKVMYSNFDVALPMYTQLIIGLGDFFQAYWYFILSGMIGFIICVKLIHKQSLNFRQWLDSLYLELPVIRKVLTYAIITRITKTIGLSFKAGMPLLKAINISVGAINNWCYRVAIQKTAEAVTRGKSLHGAMEEQKLFPPRVIQLIALGEETGALDVAFEKIAAIYSEELNNITESLNNLLEPIIMLILGILVGGLIIAMYLPIFRLGTIV
jgi:type IV pilus assembly protein PilC